MPPRADAHQLTDATAGCLWGALLDRDDGLMSRACASLPIDNSIDILAALLSTRRTRLSRALWGKQQPPPEDAPPISDQLPSPLRSLVRLSANSTRMTRVGLSAMLQAAAPASTASTGTRSERGQHTLERTCRSSQ
jgi:hypothetical protein